MKNLFVIAMLLPLWLFSQDITGVWTGYLETGGNRVPYELLINRNGDKFEGYALIVFNIKGVENIGIKSVVCKPRGGVFTVQDDELIYDNFSSPSRRVRLFCRLSFVNRNNPVDLRGGFQTKTMDFRSPDNGSYSGNVVLRKQEQTKNSRLVRELAEMHLLDDLSFAAPIQATETAPAVKDAKTKELRPAIIKKENRENPVVAPPATSANRTIQLSVPARPAADLAERRTQIIRHIPFSSDSLVLTLYDNGVVDGDTVSVVLNGQVIIPKQGLSEKAYRMVIHVPASMGDSLELLMYAENLGSIPPNTGLLIVEEGENRYEIRFEGDLQKSSAVILKRRK